MSRVLGCLVTAVTVATVVTLGPAASAFNLVHQGVTAAKVGCYTAMAATVVTPAAAEVPASKAAPARVAPPF
ncbi:Uncharacterised protein [Mycobacterium tuberculosis]|uniref:Uncharacterized protein n=1 Tax=Mycobacterium tuberculosis TaxID=1773 RepID=A0A654U862_MYCTX|nr:Uncharacterised protein [Mycobacterium tuberculosis]CFR97721.1 Uncharacterised protein [Mycobacterium tuberculosis]CFS16633.1 Uncharacterised protein [Mycobacterium tuberculosis]CFS16737.1 Uncharacterised protein [Mycobacterium tuberculosis]CFS38451.1 Uncharacterised protein [Mycobacterium tuberculosis]